MFSAYTVGRPTHTDGKRRQAEPLFSISRIDTSKAEKFVLSNSQLIQISRAKTSQDKRRVKLIITRCNRSVGRKYALRTNPFACLRHCLLLFLNDFSRKL